MLVLYRIDLPSIKNKIGLELELEGYIVGLLGNARARARARSKGG